MAAKIWVVAFLGAFAVLSAAIGGLVPRAASPVREAPGLALAAAPARHGEAIYIVDHGNRG